MTVTDSNSSTQTDSSAGERQPATASELVRPSRSKLIAGLLGLLFGVLGLHRRYLGQAYWWLLPAASLPLLGHMMREEVWFRAWSFHLLAVLVVVGWLQTIIICLMSAEKFNTRFNPVQPETRQAGTLPVLIAIIALMLGTTLLMTVMALALEGLFMARAS
ncbi:MAG: NINE protein [Burkholderiaceae bacterium]